MSTEYQQFQGVAGLMNLLGGDSSFNEIHADFDSTIDNTYDNSTLDAERRRASEYYNEHMSMMDDRTLDKFSRLFEKYDNQISLNADYQVSIERGRAFGDEMRTLLQDYSGVSEQTTFQVDRHGTMVDYIPTREEIAGYRDKKRETIATLFSAKLNEYADFHGKFRTKHGNRLNKPGFQRDNIYMENLNEIMLFGINQATDDGLFDYKESLAYQQALITGSSTPIKEYVNKEVQFNRFVSERNMQDINTLYDEGLNIQNILDKISDYHGASGEQKEKLGKQEILKRGSKTDYTTIEELVDEKANFGDNSDLSAWESDINDILSRLKQKNKTNTIMLGGQDYLQSINQSGNKFWDAQIKNIDAELPEFKQVEKGQKKDEKVQETGKPEFLDVEDETKNIIKQEDVPDKSVETKPKIKLNEQEMLLRWPKEYYSSVGVPKPDFSLVKAPSLFGGSVRRDPKSAEKIDKIYNEIKEVGLDNIKKSINKMWQTYATSPYLEPKKNKRWRESRYPIYSEFQDKKIAQMKQILRQIEKGGSTFRDVSNLKRELIRKYNQLMRELQREIPPHFLERNTDGTFKEINE